MKVKIAEEKRNPFLKRKEITAYIEHENEPTPQKAALQQWVSKETGAAEDKVEVKSVFTDAGLPKSRAKVFVWEEKAIKKEAKQEGKEEKQDGQ